MEQNTQLLDYIAEHEAIIQYNLCKRQVLRSVLSWIFCIIYYTKTCKIAISKNCQIRSAHPVQQRRRTPWAYAYSQGSFFAVGADPWVRPVEKLPFFTHFQRIRTACQRCVRVAAPYEAHKHGTLRCHTGKPMVWDRERKAGHA